MVIDRVRISTANLTDEKKEYNDSAYSSLQRQDVDKKDPRFQATMQTLGRELYFGDLRYILVIERIKVILNAQFTKTSIIW